jgi:hypothetical protein
MVWAWRVPLLDAPLGAEFVEVAEAITDRAAEAQIGRPSPETARLSKEADGEVKVFRRDFLVADGAGLLWFCRGLCGFVCPHAP